MTTDIQELQRFQLENSDVFLVGVHDQSRCNGQPCTIHNRTQHNMRMWVQHFRSDNGLMERLCPNHGTGIPDPDINHAYYGYADCGCSSLTVGGEQVAFVKKGIAITKSGKLFSYIRPGRLSSRVDTIVPPKQLASKTMPKGYIVNSSYGYIHRLTWSGWNGPIPTGLQIRHLDRTPSNNNIDNLALGTQRDNEDDKDRHGTRPMGSAHVNSKLNEQQVSECRTLWLNGASLSELELRLPDLSRPGIHEAMVGNTWRDVLPRGAHKKDILASIREANQKEDQ